MWIWCRNRPVSTNDSIRNAIDALVRARPSFWSRSACGVARSLASIPALLDRNAYLPNAARARILLIGGLSGQADDVNLALRALELYAGGGDALALRIALSAVPCANPDGLAQNAGPENGAGGLPGRGYPPEGNFYFDPHNPEKRYLWRWICYQAPDLVLELQAGNSVRWEHNPAARHLAPAVGARELNDDSLVGALGSGYPEGLAPVAAMRLTAAEEQLPIELARLFGIVREGALWQPSPARETLNGRRMRERVEIGRLLAAAYGHSFDPVVYTQGVPISGRLRLARLEPSLSSPLPEVVRLVEDYAADAAAFGAEMGPAALASVVWAGELQEATGDHRYGRLLLAAADRYHDGGDGQAPPPSDPDFRTEDMFMNAAVLGRAFQQTGEPRYANLLGRFLRDGQIQQSNGLFWHCRTAEFYWGRGNGFAAMGLAEALTYLPEQHPDRPAILEMYLRLMASLRRLQHQSGLLSQALDFPGSYLEFTATCMMGYAMARGLRRGWLPKEDYRDAAELAWQGVSERIDDVGNVADACASTGVQSSIRDYLDRPAIHGFDDRSGGLALWFTVEMERLSRGQ